LEAVARKKKEPIMSKLLYIQASPRAERSKSIAVADALIKIYQQAHPDDLIETLNVFDADLFAFDGLVVRAKYTILHGQKHTQEELSAWKAVEEVIEQFKSADKYIFAVPMWNFGIPYRLKQYIDILIQPGYTFSFSPEEGYKGLVLGKPVFVAYARGGQYSDPAYAALNHHSTYLETILGFIGCQKVISVVVEPTLMAGEEVAQKSLAEACDKAELLAKDF
jgi:FMN-dependent NADH-azoreductase